jgi:hypothetical protein
MFPSSGVCDIIVSLTVSIVYACMMDDDGCKDGRDGGNGWSSGKNSIANLGTFDGSSDLCLPVCLVSVNSTANCVIGVISACVLRCFETDGGTGSEYDILTHEWNASFQCMDRWFYNMNAVYTRYRRFGLAFAIMSSHVS